MKFGKRIKREAIPRWRAYYLDYKLLKVFLKPFRKDKEREQSKADAAEEKDEEKKSPGSAAGLSIDPKLDVVGVVPRSPTSPLAFLQGDKKRDDNDGDDGSSDATSQYVFAEFTDADELQFRHLLELEYAKIETFYCVTFDRITHRLQLAMEEAPTRKQIESIRSLIADLRSYAELNKVGLYKIMKKHDKVVGRRMMEESLQKADSLSVFHPERLDVATEKLEEIERSVGRTTAEIIADTSSLVGLLNMLPQPKQLDLGPVADATPAVEVSVLQTKARQELEEDARAGKISARELALAQAEKPFRALMIIAAAAVAFAHGSNDVANGIGPFAAMFEYQQDGRVDADSSDLPWWVLVMGGTGIVIGLFLLGYKVVDTIGSRITTLTYSKGYAAQMAASITVMLATYLGLPVSTTSTLVGSIAGVGLVGTSTASGDSGSVAGKGNGLDTVMLAKIVGSWFLSVAASAGLTCLVYIITKAAGNYSSPEL